MGEERVTILASIVADLLVFIILAFCIWQGHRKGLILTISSFVILLIAIWGASHLTDRFINPVTEHIQQLLDWVTDDAAEEAVRKQSETQITDKNLTIARDAFSGLGISSKEVDLMAEKVDTLMKNEGVSVKAAISAVFIHTFSWVILFFFFLAIVALVLTLLMHFISMLFDLPGLKMLDKVGGLAAGLLHGCVLMFAIGWGLRFLGILIPTELIGHTVLLRFFVQVNPLAVFLS
jgi:uncharacterized membrane protein required for colicin V production